MKNRLCLPEELEKQEEMRLERGLKISTTESKYNRRQSRYLQAMSAGEAANSRGRPVAPWEGRLTRKPIWDSGIRKNPHVENIHNPLRPSGIHSLALSGHCFPCCRADSLSIIKTKQQNPALSMVKFSLWGLQICRSLSLKHSILSNGA